MKIIRKKIFEVNSSSSHSVSRTEGDFIFETIYPDEDGHVLLTGGQFGWEKERYNDSLTKANYLLQYLYLKESNTELFFDTIKEMCQTEVVIDWEFLENGYIDHQSSDIFDDYTIDEEFIKDFVFNKNYWLFTSNDNSYEPCNFYDVPTYTKEGINHVKYKYGLVLKNGNQHLKLDVGFKEYPTAKNIENALEGCFEDKVLKTSKDEFELIEYNEEVFVDCKNIYDINENVSKFIEIVDNKAKFVNFNNVYHGYHYGVGHIKEFIEANLHKLEKYLDYEVIEL